MKRMVNHHDVPLRITRGRRHLTSWRKQLFAVASIVLLLSCSIMPAGAWPTPKSCSDRKEQTPDEQYCSVALNWYSEIDHDYQNYDVQNYAPPYQMNPHLYIFEHAIDLIRSEGKENWANYLSEEENFQALADGVTYADNYLGRFKAFVYWEHFWGLDRTELYSFDIGPYAGNNHFFNPSTNKGLFINPGLVSLDYLVEYQGLLFGLTQGFLDAATGGLASALGQTIVFELHPPLRPVFASAVDEAASHYRQALNNYDGFDDHLPLKTSQFNTFFQLGWSAHFIGDLALPHHVNDEWMTNHDAIEDQAIGYGSQSDYNANQWSLGRNYRDLTVQDIARATAVHAKDPSWFELAKSDNAKHRNTVLNQSIPLAEQYTAALFSKLMVDMHVPEHLPPLSGRILSTEYSEPIPGAYVFYSTGLWDDPHFSQEWDYVIADSNGTYMISNIKPGEGIYLRPAMPGYAIQSVRRETEESFEEGVQSIPYSYQHPTSIASQSEAGRTRVDFILKPRAAPSEQDQYSQQRSLTLSRTIPRPQSVVQAAEIPVLLNDFQNPYQISPALSEDIDTAVFEVNGLHTMTSFSGTKGVDGVVDGEYIEIHLSNLFSLNESRILRSADDITSSIRQAKERIALQKIRTSYPNSVTSTNVTTNTTLIDTKVISALQEAFLALPEQEISINGTSTKVHMMTYGFDRGSAFPGSENLVNYGIMRIPDKGGAKIEVRLDAGYGLIGPQFYYDPISEACKWDEPTYSCFGLVGPLCERTTPTLDCPTCMNGPGPTDMSSLELQQRTSASQSEQSGVYPYPTKSIVLTTNQEGVAAFKILAGNQSGKIRIHLKVIENPAAPNIKPEYIQDIIIQPSKIGRDPVQLSPPTLWVVEPAPMCHSNGPSPLIDDRLTNKFDTRWNPPVKLPLPDEHPLARVVYDLLFIPEWIISLAASEPASPPSNSVFFNVIDNSCDDMNLCTENDQYRSGVCTGESKICNDGNESTHDTCNPSGGCEYYPIAPLPATISSRFTESCDDNNLCTVNDTLDEGNCLGVARSCDDTNPDTYDYCDPGSGCRFVHLDNGSNTSLCDDNDICTVNDHLMNGVCQGETFTCDDGNSATQDRCDPQQGCMFVPLQTDTLPSSSCDDGDACTANDRLIGGICTGDQRTCDDGKTTTIDTCDPLRGCVFSPVPTTQEDVCPAPCECLYESEAQSKFGHYYTRCSEIPCYTDYSHMTAVLYKYCYRESLR